MINLKYTYQPSHSLDEANTQITNLVELLKSELLQAATNENIEAVTLKVEQTSDDGFQRLAQVQAAVGDTAAKVGMLATYNTASGSITVSAALVNGIEQSDITLSGDQITLNGNVTIANNFMLTGSHIVSGTITATQIASETITAAEIHSGAISSDKIATGAITADKIDAGAISVQNLINAYGQVIKVHNGIWYDNPNNPNDYVLLDYNGIVGGDADLDEVFAGQIYTNYIGGPGATALNITTAASINAGASVYNGTTFYSGDITFEANSNVIGHGIANKTASTTNPNMRCRDNSHQLALISGSSRRFKHDIKKVEKETLNPKRLYDMPVIQFTYNEDYLSEDDPRQGEPICGFIAEDVNEIYPIACDMDEEKNIPNDWNVRYIVPPMLALIQEQNERIKRLEARYGE